MQVPLRLTFPVPPLKSEINAAASVSPCGGGVPVVGRTSFPRSPGPPSQKADFHSRLLKTFRPQPSGPQAWAVGLPPRRSCQFLWVQDTQPHPGPAFFLLFLSGSSDLHLHNALKS